MIGISGWFMDEHFSAENIPFEIKYFHLIPFHSIPFHSKSPWLEGPDVRKRTLFSRKYSL